MRIPGWDRARRMIPAAAKCALVVLWAGFVSALLLFA